MMVLSKELRHSSRARARCVSSSRGQARARVSGCIVEMNLDARSRIPALRAARPKGASLSAHSGSHFPSALPSRSWVRWLGLALLAGYLLFCHGCHGDEDNELFASYLQPLRAARVKLDVMSYETSP